MSKSEYIMISIFTTIGALFAFIAIFVESTVNKWVWGVLAAAVFIFTIYATIDAIVKSRKKPKDFADLMISYLEHKSKEPGFREELAKNMENCAKRRDILFDSQKPENEDFGYSYNNPIMTSTFSSKNTYLQNLRTLDGKSFTWERLGSCCVPDIAGIKDVMVDKYQLYLDGEKYVELYICPYGHSSSYVPHGLTLAE